MTEDVSAELARLQAENSHLKAILRQHGITWGSSLSSAPPVLEDVTIADPVTPPSVVLSPAGKIALFQSLFRGRTDVYPQRWESQKGTSGYSPVCGNEWRPGICGKPKVRCGDCEHRQLTPLTEQALYDHLAGKKTLGVYPCCSPAGNAMFPPRWKYPAPAKARTSGFSFPFRCPLVKPACWEPRLSAIPAKERANSL